MKVILLIVVVFSLTLLTGCIDFDLTICGDNGGECVVLTEFVVAVDCEDVLGGKFSGTLMRGLSQGHYVMSPHLLGADPLTMDMGYDCRVYPFPYECCGRVRIPPGETSALGQVICGMPNECYDPD